jgi:hypothetical protein
MHVYMRFTQAMNKPFNLDLYFVLYFYSFQYHCAVTLYYMF